VIRVWSETMGTPSGLPLAVTAEASLDALFARQRDESRRAVEVPLALRRERLDRLARLWREHEAPLAQAVGADFGLRGVRLTRVADGFVIDALLADLRRNLTRWSRPRRVRTPVYLQPA